MLCLSRKLNECLVIDGSIKVMIVKIEGGRIVLGVEAPPDVKVHRQEVWDRINQDDNDGKPDGV